MKRDTKQPAIRILILGAPGVGKNCLESRFTTATYPPPYDPALTLNSRRYLTLHSQPGSPVVPITRPLATSHGLDALSKPDLPPQDRPRYPGGSSTCSNPASEARSESWEANITAETSPAVSSEQRPCSLCIREADTYLVEVINYPALQSAKVRSHVLAKGGYDAVLLVYDVGNRKTFETIMDLHSEIPLGRRWRRGSHSIAASRTKRGLFRRGSVENTANLYSGGETVVALVGNKADFDADYASIELGLDGPLSEKMAVLEEVDLEERSLVHPLFRESRLYDEMSSPTALLPAISPGAQTFHGRSTYRQDISDVRRSVLSADHILDSRLSILSLQRSVRTVPARTGRHRRSVSNRYREDPARIVENWLEIRNPIVDQDLNESPREEPSARRDSTETASTTAAKRQVSKLEGEMLARTLLLQVPFFETSAKTGEMVEEVFAEIVQAVLREMGLDVTSQGAMRTLQQRCDRKHACQGRHNRQGTLPDEAIPAQSFQTHDQTRPAGVEATADTSEKTQQQPQDTKMPVERQVGRERMMQRMKRVLKRKPPAVAVDIAACEVPV